jgi:predicted transcriptional regulator
MGLFQDATIDKLGIIWVDFIVREGSISTREIAKNADLTLSEVSRHPKGASGQGSVPFDESLKCHALARIGEKDADRKKSLRCTSI